MCGVISYLFVTLKDGLDLIEEKDFPNIGRIEFCDAAMDLYERRGDML